MNSKHLFAAALVIAGSATLRAEFSTTSVVINAKSDPRNSGAIVAMAAIENPKYTLRIVRATTLALPNHVIAIVRAVLKVDPREAPGIVREAILSQPTLAVDITKVAVTMYPDQTAAIAKAATEAAPANLRNTISDLWLNTSGGSSAIDSSGVSGGNPVTPGFPSQPLNDPIVTPAT